MVGEFRSKDNAEAQRTLGNAESAEWGAAMLRPYKSVSILRYAPIQRDDL